MRRVASERIRILFDMAERMFHRDPRLSDRYVEIARRISMKTHVRIPREYRLRFCKGCGAYLVPGVNCRVRVRSRREPHLVVTCMRCGRIIRFPLRR